MLNKIMKYELKATTRIFLPLFAAALLSALINRVIMLLSPDSWQAPAVISMTLYVIILIGMFVMTFIVLIQRFYKNLLSEEGYLMHTLPVNPWVHITGKLLISSLWTLLSGIVAILSVLIIAADGGFLREAGHVLSEIIQGITDTKGAPLLVFQVILTFFIALFSGPLMIYAAIAIGHLVNDHRILASIGAYIGLSTVVQILFVAMASTPIPGLGLSTLFNARNPENALLINPNMNGISPVLHHAMWILILFSLLVSAGYFAITNAILAKKLNLE